MGAYNQSDIDSFLNDSPSYTPGFKVDPEVQAKRDGLRRTILNQELESASDPAVRASVQREIDSMSMPPSERNIKTAVASLPASNQTIKSGKYSSQDIDAFLGVPSDAPKAQVVTPSQIKPGSVDYTKPLPQIRPDKVQVGALEGGARGVGSGFADIGNVLGLAGGGAASLVDVVANLFRDAPQTNAQDAYFKNVYDPLFKNAVDSYAIKPNEDLTKGGVVTNTAGRMVAPILGTIATGGTSGAAALPSLVRGAIAAQPAFAVPATVNRAQQLMEQGADLPSVAKASAANYGMNTLLGALPASAAGNIVKRALSGAAINTATGAAQRKIEGAALGDENANLAQEAFNPQATGQDAILGSVMAALFGPRAAAMQAGRARVEPALPDANEVVARNTVQPQMSIADLISQITGAKNLPDSPDARAAQVKGAAAEHNATAKELSKVFSPVVKDAESVYPQLGEQPYRYGDPASMQITTEQLRKYAPQLEANNIRSIDDPRAYGLIKRLEARDAAQSALPENTPVDMQGQGRIATDKEFGISAGIDSYLKQLEDRLALTERRLAETQGDRVPQKPFQDIQQESLQLRNRRAEDLIRQTQGARDANINPAYRENIDGTQALEVQNRAAPEGQKSPAPNDIAANSGKTTNLGNGGNQPGVEPDVGEQKPVQPVDAMGRGDGRGRIREGGVVRQGARGVVESTSGEQLRSGPGERQPATKDGGLGAQPETTKTYSTQDVSRETVYPEKAYGGIDSNGPPDKAIPGLTRQSANRLVAQFNEQGMPSRVAEHPTIKGKFVVEPVGNVDEKTASNGVGSAVNEPAQKHGFVRVYHSGSAGDGDSGRWVSTNRNYASDYRSDLPLFYSDIPANDPRVTNADYPEQSVKNGFTFNFELSPDEAKNLRRVSREQVPKSEITSGGIDEQEQPQQTMLGGSAKKPRESSAPDIKPVEQPKNKPAKDGTTWEDLFKKVREDTGSSIEEGVQEAKKLKPGAGTLHANPLPEMMTAARKLLISDEAAESAKNLASRIADRVTGLAKGVEQAPKKGEENIAAAAVRATVSSIGTRLRQMAKIYDSPATEQLANILQRQPGSGKEIAEPFGEAVASRSKEFRNELSHPLEGKENWFGDLKKEHIPELQQVRRLVQNRAAINSGTEIGKIAKAWSSTLDNVLEYAQSKGLDVQKTEDFFPRVVDSIKIADPKMYAAFERDLAKVYEAGGASAEEAKQAAASYAYAKRMQGLGVKENPFHDILGGAPKTKSIKHRVLAKAADEMLAKYMVDNPFEALNDYVGGVVKAAEFESRRPMIEDLRKQIKKEGNEHILGAVDNYLLGAIGPVQSGDAAKFAQTFSQAYSTIKYLRLSSLVSLASEPFVMAQRVSTDPVSYVKNLGKAYGNILLGSGGAAAKAWLGVDPSKIPGLKDTAQMQRFAEAIGTVANDMTHGIEHVVMADGIDDAPTSSAKIGKANQAMRHLAGRAVTASGLRRLTEVQHATMTKMASFFVKEMATEYADKKTGLSARELRDMGVPDAQRDAFVKYVSSLESPWQAVQEKYKNPMARLYVQALNAVDRQGVQEPTRADKPIGNRHPLGTLVYSLTGFMHAFHNNVLARMVRQGKDAILNQSGDLSPSDRLRLLTPIAALPAAYAAQYGFTYLYDQIKGTPEEKQDAKDKPAVMFLTGDELPWSQRTAEAVSRLGLFGKYDPWVNMLTSARYGKSPSSGLIGPTYSSINDLLTTAMQTGTEKDSKNTNTHERMTAKLFYESLLDPAVDAASLAFGSPLTSVAVPQLMKRDETKSAFVDEVAGEKIEGRKRRKRRATDEEDD